MAVNDDTLEAEGSSNFFSNIGETSVDAVKILTSIVLKTFGRM